MKNSLPWLRLYTEIIDDEKLGLLSFEDRWHFIAILCLKGKGILDTEPDEELLQRKVALKMGLSNSELEKVAARIERMGLIDAKTFQPLAWNNRQMQSDSSSERVKTHREKLKNKMKQEETLQKRFSNGVDIDIDKEESTPHVLSLTADDVQDGDSATASMPACPHQEIIKLYAENLPELPQPRIWEGTNRENLKKRWRWVISDLKAKGKPHAVSDGLDFFKRMFSYINESDFLCGRGAAWAGADLGWIAKGANFAKILQGNYENKGAAS